jgi:hypothetical protein
MKEQIQAVMDDLGAGYCGPSGIVYGTRHPSPKRLGNKRSQRENTQKQCRGNQFVNHN